MNVENGNTVSFHYVGTLDDGTEFDNSITRGEPLTSQIGQGQMIQGFESALLGMEVGEKKSVLINANDAYGEYNNDAVRSFPIDNFSEGFVPILGETVQGQNELGQTFSATIKESTEDTVTLDFNHPLAGKNLNFEIEVLTIED